MRNLLFASVRDGNSGAENIWMVYQSETDSFLTFPSLQAAEDKEYALTPERTVYRKDRKQVAYVNRSVAMGRGKTGVALVLEFDANKEKRYAAEIIGASCPDWLNADTVVTTWDAKEYLSKPSVYGDWVSQSPIKRSYANRNAVLALIDTIIDANIKGEKQPILLYSSRSGGDVSIPLEVYTVLKTALLSLPVAIANGISFSTYTESEGDLTGMDVVCVSGRGMEVNAAWKEQYTAIDIAVAADATREPSTFYGKLVEKRIIQFREEFTVPLPDLTNVMELEKAAALEFFHTALGEMAETCTATGLQTLHDLYIQSGVEENEEERKNCYQKLLDKRVVFDDEQVGNALVFWLEKVEQLVSIPDKGEHCELEKWEKAFNIVNGFSSTLGDVVKNEFHAFEERFIESVSLQELQDEKNKEKSEQFYSKAKELGFFNLEEMFREKFIEPQNPALAGKELELAKKYFYCSDDETKAEFCDMLFKAEKDWQGGTGKAVALLSWMRAVCNDLPEKILEDVSGWGDAKNEFEGYCTDEQKDKLNDLLLKKCEKELIPLLGDDPTQCEQKWNELIKDKKSGSIQERFGFNIDKYIEGRRKAADDAFRKAYESILEEPDSADSKILEMRQKYTYASDEARKAGYIALFNDPKRRAVAADCVIVWEDLPQAVKTIPVLARWKKVLQYLSTCLESYSEQTAVLSKRFKEMCCAETVGAKSSLIFWIEIMKSVEDLTKDKLIRKEDGEAIKKHLFELCDRYFEGLLKGPESMSLVTSENHGTYRDLIEYGYSGKYLKTIENCLQKELDLRRYDSVQKGLQTSCDDFYMSIMNWDPDAEEETRATKAARHREMAWRAGGIVCRFVVWFIIATAVVALISVLSPMILKWFGIADTVETSFSAMHLQFLLNAPSACGFLALMVYLVTSVWYCVMHEKSIGGWRVIFKSLRNMVFCVLIPFTVGFVALIILIFVL